jgi:type II secretory ATPase GspE/PulE/Tfp pilus assembly ATPase PilB-like protein
MVEASFNQMQVQSSIDLNFADGIRALMRQDPDIIMVGEIRDLETAEMAVQAALTGHLVLRPCTPMMRHPRSCVCWNSAFRIICWRQR